jgi:predicted O-methyltransferase YrrM
MDMPEVYRPARMLSDLRESTGIENMVKSAASAAQIEQVLADLLGGGEIQADDGTVHSLFPVAISAEEGQELRDWVVREDAKSTIEVGLAYGVSALFICQGLVMNGDDGARHTVLDPNQATRFANCGLQALARAGVAPMVEHHPEESQIALPRFVAEGRRFDLAFVDGNHRYDAVFLDLIHLGRLVRGGGIIFLDDYQLPAVSRAVSFCVTNLDWTVENISTPDAHHQWAVLRSPAKPKERPFDYFVDF